MAAGLISLVAGLPLGLALVITDRGGIAENLWVNRILGAIINAFRSVPFIILLVALIPLTRLIVGTALGTWAAIVPLAIAATPYYARIAEVSLREVDHGLVEAVRAMGGGRWTIIREVLVPDALLADRELQPALKELGPRLTPRPAVSFDSQTGERLLRTQFGVATLDGLGVFTRAELSAAGALVGYLDMTQKGKRSGLKPLKRDSDTGRMSIDAATRRNLELTETLNGERRGSLLSVIDDTVTAAGARGR